ncbi:hypothetical protein NL676_027658 [Syzygium grande]|nr:hypothetical protein NL676_027658 [Syzygium grande]
MAGGRVSRPPTTSFAVFLSLDHQQSLMSFPARSLKFADFLGVVIVAKLLTVTRKSYQEANTEHHREHYRRSRAVRCEFELGKSISKLGFPTNAQYFRIIKRESTPLLIPGRTSESCFGVMITITVDLG